MPNNDYVLRSDALAYVRHAYPKGLNLLMAYINVIPAADVEPVRHGYNVKWDYPTLFECSLCGWECFDTVPGDTDTYQYCPSCGAKMDAAPLKEKRDD